MIGLTDILPWDSGSFPSTKIKFHAVIIQFHDIPAQNGIANDAINPFAINSSKNRIIVDMKIKAVNSKAWEI